MTPAQQTVLAVAVLLLVIGAGLLADTIGWSYLVGIGVGIVLVHADRWAEWMGRSR